MIRIAVCDDDKSIREEIHQYLKWKNLQSNDVEWNITLCQSGVDFLRAVDLGIGFHIVFMDIQMDGMDGIEVGKTLRDRSDADDTVMIYISNHDTYYEGLVDIGSFRFIKKPINTSRLDYVFSRALNQVMKPKGIADRPKLFLYKVNTETHSVRADKIAYMKNDKKMVEIFVWDDDRKTISFLDRFYSNMADVVAQLSKEQYIQCERSHIANLNYVRRMTADTFTLTDKDNTEIPIGRAFKGSVKEAYIKHRGNQYG